ncbi:helix-turn-helix domain-containing protein [Wenyingzhuangia aestuarii]|uniref:helix-turn-helix domain-containing protein n=1 Tax=Wenyingzhuangia aestuarii TaxID=1647582 RepID=UPI00143B4650|nr:helix-turn-helix transcriptional regulator [Wenyingzhuangia aestuarii]NJB82683.1 AraC-like DNA-binding protein [Wenyingzhuangia aestuarii]
MKEEIQHIASIHQLHSVFGLDKTLHPLISLIDVSTCEIDPSLMGKKIKTSLYSISLKDKSCGMEYGRNTYDFNEGTLIFMAPNQVVTAHKDQVEKVVEGWMLFFHPDLIRNTPLGAKIDNYKFFSYDVHEALHLSQAEEKIVTDCVQLIKNETLERIDNHSQTVIASTLELILNYATRFYERQFNTRSAQNSDVVASFNQLLKDYYQHDLFAKNGVPSLEYFAENIHLSPNYLSDLLKKETGYSVKDSIHNFIVEKAKTLLLSKDDTIAGIAYQLGFNYPHYFSRLFKSKTGYAPNEYRSLSSL